MADMRRGRTIAWGTSFPFLPPPITPLPMCIGSISSLTSSRQEKKKTLNFQLVGTESIIDSVDSMASRSFYPVYQSRPSTQTSLSLDHLSVKKSNMFVINLILSRPMIEITMIQIRCHTAPHYLEVLCRSWPRPFYGSCVCMSLEEGRFHVELDEVCF